MRCHRFFFLIEFLIYINFHNRKLYVSWLHCNSTSILPQAKLLRSKRKLWNELEWCQSKPVCECMRQCSSSSGWTRIDSIKENAQRVWLLRCKHSHHIAANGSRIIYIYIYRVIQWDRRHNIAMAYCLEFMRRAKVSFRHIFLLPPRWFPLLFVFYRSTSPSTHFTRPAALHMIHLIKYCWIFVHTNSVFVVVVRVEQHGEIYIIDIWIVDWWWWWLTHHASCTWQRDNENDCAVSCSSSRDLYWCVFVCSCRTSVDLFIASPRSHDNGSENSDSIYPFYSWSIKLFSFLSARMAAAFTRYR